MKKIRLLTASLLLGLLSPSALVADTDSPAQPWPIEDNQHRFAQQRLTEWEQLMADYRNHSEQEKLEQVNAFFNSNVVFLSDMTLWKKRDYWATPKEMLTIGGGDCEDYAIAKYITLKQLGVDEEKLRLTYVKAIELNQAHMVLTYFEHKRAEPLVLDNLIPEIKPASQRQDLLPVYSFNGSGLWLSRAKGDQRVKNAAGLSLWQNVLFRMEQGH